MGKNYNHTRGRDGKYCNNTTYFRGKVLNTSDWKGRKDNHAPLLYGGDLPIKREKKQEEREESWQTSALGRLVIRICNKCRLTTITGGLPVSEQEIREGELSNA